jgi:hypothetical protein
MPSLLSTEEVQYPLLKVAQQVAETHVWKQHRTENYLFSYHVYIIIFSTSIFFFPEPTPSAMFLWGGRCMSLPLACLQNNLPGFSSNYLWYQNEQIKIFLFGVGTLSVLLMLIGV